MQSKQVDLDLIRRQFEEQTAEWRRLQTTLAAFPEGTKLLVAEALMEEFEAALTPRANLGPSMFGARA